MEAAVAQVLEAQRKSHPDLGEQLDEIERLLNSKLYHQLTGSLLKYVKSAPFVTDSPAVASELLDLFNDFIKGFETKFDKVRWLEIVAIVCKPQTPAVALDLLAAFEASVAKQRDAKFLWQTLKAEKQILGGDTDDAKELLDILGKEIDDSYEVDAFIQSQFQKTHAMLWKHLGRWQDFYKSSLLYMAFTPIAAIPAEDRPRIAFEVGVAALVAEEEFNFGELLQQELLSSLDGTQYAWIKDILQAFGEGKFAMYDEAFTKHRASIDSTPELKSAEADVLRPKMCALALMELAFRKPKKQRRLTFEEIAEHCRVGPREVEFLVMKSMCANLIQGQIDEVAQLVMVSWVKPRILDTVRIDLLRQRMDSWQKQTGLLLEHLEEMTPELLVS